MLSGLLADKYFLESLTLSSSLLPTGTSNNTLMSKSASFLYRLVKIETIREYLITGYSVSNTFNCFSICALTLGLILGSLVSASSNTLGAYVLLGISMMLSMTSLNFFIYLLFAFLSEAIHLFAVYDLIGCVNNFLTALPTLFITCVVSSLSSLLLSIMTMLPIPNRF